MQNQKRSAIDKELKQLLKHIPHSEYTFSIFCDDIFLVLTLKNRLIVHVTINKSWFSDFMITHY